MLHDKVPLQESERKQVLALAPGSPAGLSAFAHAVRRLGPGAHTTLGVCAVTGLTALKRTAAWIAIAAGVWGRGAHEWLGNQHPAFWITIGLLVDVLRSPMKISRIPFRFSSVLLCIFFSPAYVKAEESRLSLMAQNDVFVGSDGGGYTSGITLSHLRSVSPGQTSIAPLPVLGTLAPWLGVGPATLTRFSLSQIMVTPRDLTRKIPDPADAPYVGALWLGAGQVSLREEVADIVGLRIGVMGPASGARRTQTLIHSVIGSDRPQGWDTQGPNRLLLGVERYRGWRLASTDEGDGRPHADAVVVAGATLGNLQSSAGASLLLRYGTRLKRSYPASLRQELRSADPVLLGTGWFVYAGLYADRVFSQAGIGRNRYADSSTAELRHTQSVAVAGVAYGFRRASVSFSLQSASPLITSTNERELYGSLTCTVPW